MKPLKTSSSGGRPSVSETRASRARRKHIDACSLWPPWPELLRTYGDAIAFYTPDICVEETRRHIPDMAARRCFNPSAAVALLDELTRLVNVMERNVYQIHEEAARARIASRDPDDWPVVAAALFLDCPIWTEDRDFFGSGIATWTTRNVELYLGGA
jgi:predicted nucleic acid-binding protein